MLCTRGNTLPDIMCAVFFHVAAQSTHLPEQAQHAASSRRVTTGGATGVTGSGSRGEARDNSDPHDGSQGGGLCSYEWTAADIRAALEGKPKLMTELGLVWVEQARGGVQAESERRRRRRPPFRLRLISFWLR